jgi:hypothetical protein
MIHHPLVTTLDPPLYLTHLDCYYKSLTMDAKSQPPQRKDAAFTELLDEIPTEANATAKAVGNLGNRCAGEHPKTNRHLPIQTGFSGREESNATVVPD